MVLRIDSGTSKHFVADISLFTSRDPGVAIVTFNTAAGTTMTSRALDTVKFKASDSNGDPRIVTLEGTYHVPHQSHNLVTVKQLTRYAEKQWSAPAFRKCVWVNPTGQHFVFELVRQEYIWNVTPLSGERKSNGDVQQSLVMTRSKVREQSQIDDGAETAQPILQPSAHKKVARAARASFQNELEHIHPVARKYFRNTVCHENCLTIHVELTSVHNDRL